jgi:hypothetical protein
VIIPLASICKYKKVIKINLTTALNSRILRSLVQWFPNGYNKRKAVMALSSPPLLLSSP